MALFRNHIPGRDNRGQSDRNSGRKWYLLRVEQRLSGVNETIAFSTSGLPPTVTGVFNPASLTGSGTSTLTVTTTASTPTGIIFTIVGTVTGAGGTETHVANAQLIVGPGHRLLVYSHASVQIIPAGQITTYTVSTSAIAGFNGSVSLGISQLPPGVQASFNPNTITGSGSSTLTLTTSSTTPSRSYALTITATSGATQASTMVGLFLYAPFATTGSGCSVGFAFNPAPPVPGQPFTLTGTLQGIVSGNTGVGAIALDHQQLCAATNTAACVQPVGPLTEGTHELEWTCTSSGANPGTGAGNQLFTVGPAKPDGSVSPKYLILSVIYAPPGKASTVDYGSSTVPGTSASVTDSFELGINVSATVSKTQEIKAKTL